MLKKIIPFVITAGLLLAPTAAFAANNASDQGDITKGKTAQSTKEIEEVVIGEFQLKAKTNDLGQVRLKWLKNLDGTGYMIYRSATREGGYKLVKTIPDQDVTSYVDKSVKNKNTYYYQVTPILVEPINSFYETVSVKTSAQKLKSAIKVRGTSATIKWSRLKNAEGYEIYRSTSANGKYKKIHVIKNQKTKSWTDGSLNNNKKYFYKVCAYDGNSRTEFSEIQETGIILTDTWSSGKLAWPVPSVHGISSGFGMRTAPTAGATAQHDGIDIGAGAGTTVVAADNGTVVNVTQDSARGLYVDVDHGNGIVTRYQHLSAASVKVGQSVERGQSIAAVGSTGVSTGAHLHFEVLVGGTPVNPMKYINN